jgi:hypothetical protein
MIWRRYWLFLIANGIHLLSKPFTHTVSVNNIRYNTRFISNFIRSRNRPTPDFNLIYFVTIKVATLAEAFSFFDTQNNRGKKLEDIDIVKAHHLRFIEEDWVATECSQLWEKMQRDQEIDLSLLMGRLVGQGRKFSRKEYAVVNIQKEFRAQLSHKAASGPHLLNRYQQPPLAGSWEFRPRQGGLRFELNEGQVILDGNSLTIQDQFGKFFPFQVDQALAGGESFFLYARKYHLLYRKLFIEENEQLSDFFTGLLQELDRFSGSTGASYVHQLFCTASLFYIDKFGYERLDEIAAHLFFGIYWLRFRQSSVSYASVLKFMREEDGLNPFSLLALAGHADHIVQVIDDFLEGKYIDLNESTGIRRSMFDRLISEVTNGYFTRYAEHVPDSLRFI